ncbi:unnamed protein product [Cylindrotheca closterium]|uniref:Uncharacterized protein n=1 Tax=Cylindrotheca closterium TaxID=2856 RepID=A0AAD2G5B1_9STRA|nr:unnamed protein product [Cylindrotheca closterium]
MSIFLISSNGLSHRGIRNLRTCHKRSPQIQLVHWLVVELGRTRTHPPILVLPLACWLFACWLCPPIAVVPVVPIVTCDICVAASAGIAAGTLLDLIDATSARNSASCVSTCCVCAACPVALLAGNP